MNDAKQTTAEWVESRIDLAKSDLVARMEMQKRFYELELDRIRGRMFTLEIVVGLTIAGLAAMVVWIVEVTRG